MKEYRFQNTNQKYMIYLMLGCFGSLFILMFIGITIFHKSNFLFIISLISPFIIFWVFKKKVVFNCIAEINDEYLKITYENDEAKLIDFKNLISYKIFYSNKGPIVNLKLKNEHIRLYVHNFYCDDEPFYLFCKDFEFEIEKYNGSHNIKIIDEGSIFIKKGMLYFLIISTLIYIVISSAFPKLRMPVAFGGGMFLFIMWLKYYIENQKLKEKNVS